MGVSAFLHTVLSLLAGFSWTSLHSRFSFWFGPREPGSHLLYHLPAYLPPLVPLPSCAPALFYPSLPSFFHSLLPPFFLYLFFASHSAVFFDSHRLSFPLITSFLFTRSQERIKSYLEGRKGRNGNITNSSSYFV